MNKDNDTTKTVNDLMFTIKSLETLRETDGILIDEQFDTIRSLQSQNACLESQLDELLYESNRI